MAQFDAFLLSHDDYRGGPIERSLVLRNFPAPKARPREAPSMQLCPAPSQARLRAFYASSLQRLWLGFACQVRFWRHHLQYQARTKHKRTVPEKAAE